jgi:nucleotide-binding universal stress UspA family protein
MPTRPLVKRGTSRLADVTEIVVPHDGSELAARAPPLADLLAERTDAWVSRVTVVPPEEAGTEDYALVPGIGVSRILAGDDPAEAIATYLSSEPGRILCTSTHGRGRLGAGLLGSVTEGLLRRSSEPTVLLGPNAGPAPDRIQRIVACVDGSSHSETILPVAATWAADLGAGLALVQVVEPTAGWGADPYVSGDAIESSYVHGLARRLGGLGISPEWEVLRGREPSAPIIDHARRMPGTLIAVATHGRSGWSRVAMGSVAMRLAHDSPTPLLVVRPPTLDPGRSG